MYGALSTDLVIEHATDLVIEHAMPTTDMTIEHKND